MTTALPSIPPASPRVLKYASGPTALSGRRVMIGSASVLAIIGTIAMVVHAAAWTIADARRRSVDYLPWQEAMLRHMPANLGLFIGVVSLGGLGLCVGHWLQSRPVERWRLLRVLIFIHIAGLTAAYLKPQSPERATQKVLARWPVGYSVM